MRPYAPGGILIALTPARKGSIPPTPSIHRLRLGLPGYLIPFAPGFRASASVVVQKAAFATGVPPNIYAFHRYTRNSAFLSDTLASQFRSPHGLSPALLRPTYDAACAPFTPNNSGQRLPPTYYRGCWHVVSRGFLLRYRHLRRVLTVVPFVPYNRTLQPEGRHRSRGVAPSDFRPLRKIPHCCLRRSLGRVSVPMWPFILSDRLLIVALVGRYPSN